MTDFNCEKQVLSQIIKSEQLIQKMCTLLKCDKETVKKLFDESFIKKLDSLILKKLEDIRIMELVDKFKNMKIN